MHDDATVTATSTERPDAAAVPVPTLTLVFHPDARFVGRRCALEANRPVEIGRGGEVFGPGALEDPRLSRRHAQVCFDGRGVRVRDLGSRNGTTLGAATVIEAEIAPGSVLGAGKLLALLHLAPAVYAEPDHGVILGRSHALAEVLAQIERVAGRSTAVLVHGETGTGKELVAREIHGRSGRTGRLVPVNVGAVPDALLHGELFGHVRGAFTGAERDRPGLVAEAAGGTLFLDEIGEASPSLQVSLLRLLQEGEYRQVGGSRALRADVRVVAATHRDLAAEVAAGRFREDLQRRIARWVLRVPPLRERLDDLPFIAGALAARHAGAAVRLGAELTLALLGHAWPGNVRELDAIVERVVVESSGAEWLGVPPWLPGALAPSAPRSAAPPGAPRPRVHVRPEAAALLGAFGAAGGNIKAMAKALGIGRQTAYRWLAEAGIDVEALRREQAEE